MGRAEPGVRRRGARARECESPGGWERALEILLASLRGGQEAGAGAQGNAGALPRTSARARTHALPPRCCCHHLGAEPCGTGTGAGAGSGAEASWGCGPGTELRADCAPGTVSVARPGRCGEAGIEERRPGARVSARRRRVRVL